MFVGPIVLNKCLKFRDPSLNRSGEILSEAVGDSFFPYNFRLASYPYPYPDVISGMAVDNDRLHDHVQFSDSKSKGFRDIQGADFVSNEQTNRTKPIPVA